MGRADVDGAELGAKVARLVASGARVREQQVEDVAALAALLVES